MKIRMSICLLLTILMSIKVMADVKISSTLANVLPASVKGTQLLFVILSKNASIQIADEKKQIYQLTLKQVNSNVIYFADRPTRLSGEIELTQLVNQWLEGSFKKEPPNAVMVAVRLNEDRPSKRVNYAIVLRNPVYDVKKNQLTFEISNLPGNKLALPNFAHSNYVALFIDPCLGCVGF